MENRWNWMKHTEMWQGWVIETWNETQVLRVPLQPGLEHFQGQDMHNFSGQPVPMSHYLLNFFLTNILNLSTSSLNPFSFVLAIFVLVNSLSFFKVPFKTIADRLQKLYYYKFERSWLNRQEIKRNSHDKSPCGLAFILEKLKSNTNIAYVSGIPVIVDHCWQK